MSPRKTWLALILLAATVAVTVSLGRWQLHRAAEKEALAAAVEAGRRQPPLQLGPDQPAADLVPWRPVRAVGRWLPDRTVLLDNRMAAGRPGLWVVTPLVFESGHGRYAAVAVLRGWLPRPLAAGAPIQVPTPGGPVEVAGELLEHVPRLLDLTALTGHAAGLSGHWPDAARGPPRVQNLELHAYAQAAGMALMPVFVQQTSEAPDGLVRAWPGPPDNIDMHRGYALQWFSFAAIAAIVFGVLLVRHFRSAR